MIQIRIERTELELNTLSAAIVKWLDDRNEADRDENDAYRGQYKTQLETIGSVLTEAIHTLCAKLALARAAIEVGEVYDQCRDIDEAIVWVQRLWEYFKEKFDQRDDEERMGPLLKAADEVVWSCYNQVFVQARVRDRSLKKGPSPLAYIEPEYSPAALQADKPLPQELRINSEVTLLNDFVKTLPVPVLRLPPWCIDAPWWLIYIGHEVGHHVQHDLKLIGYFRKGLEAAATAQGVPADDIELWGKWGEEIFADIFSILILGKWAVWAIAEAERSTSAEMVKRKALYPSPIIRLALMAQAARALGIDVSAAFRGIDARALVQSDPLAQRDAQVVPGAVGFALGPMRDHLGTLQSLCGLGENEQRTRALERINNKVKSWTQHLREQAPLGPECKPETARDVICASLSAWSEIIGIEDVAMRAQERRTLSRNTKKTLIENAPPDTRAAGDGTLAGKGEEIINQLLNVSRQRRAREKVEGGS